MVADRPDPDNRDVTEGTAAVEFGVVRRGYDPAAVEAYLRRLDAQMQILTVDRNAAVEQSHQMGLELEACRARVDRLRGQVGVLSTPTLTVGTTSERVRSMLRLVEDDILELSSRLLDPGLNHCGDAEHLLAVCAGSMRAAARAAVAAVEAEHHHAAAEVATARRDDAAHNAAAMAAVEAERVRVLAELETVRRVHTDQIKQAAAAAEAALQAEQARAWADSQARCAQAWAEAQARCAQVEHDFRLALDSRRSEALALLSSEREQTRRMNEELRATAIQEAGRTVDDARIRTRQILEESERQMTLLRRQRELLISRLDAAQKDVHSALNGLLLPVESGPSD